jgi:hypothetical protein
MTIPIADNVVVAKVALAAVDITFVAERNWDEVGVDAMNCLRSSEVLGFQPF